MPWFSRWGLGNVPTAATTAVGTPWQWLGQGTSATSALYNFYQTYNGQTASTASSTAYLHQWSNIDTFTVSAPTSTFSQIFWVEDDLETAQYLALARSRVEGTRVRQIEVARIHESQRRQTHEAWEQQQRDIRLARERSKELLLAHLTPRQRKTLDENGWFIVHGGRSNTKYRIRTASVAINIDVFEGDRISHRLCGHLSHGIPHYDHILAQKVSLELDEDTFVRICNRHAA